MIAQGRASASSPRRILPTLDLNSLQPLVMPMTGLLPSPIQPRKFTARDNEELMEPPRAGEILREVAKMAAWPAVGGY
ncbi:unnamed protein product [Toxocara canis]|uniref:NADH-quinone oxidoreductase subunit B n=1 Tax=Toxocara canis TaxID=6265 RepID=A0A183U9Z2_TOXCA|nr:unnamed protein product [Toxocara canis]